MNSPGPVQFLSNMRAFTLGAEMELQVLDAGTFRLTPRAPELMENCGDPRLVKEMYRSTLELVTGICMNAIEVRAELESSLAHLRGVAAPLGLRFAGTGTNPVADYNDRIVSQSERYQQLMHRNQWLIRRMAVYGLHVHLGMRSGDDCIHYMNQFLSVVPHLIALSASSPFWRGVDTGLAASRPTVYEAHPPSAMPPIMKDWQAFSTHHDLLVKTGAIASVKDLWWDLRPSPGYGTLELRICDGPATLLELEAIVAFIHVQAHVFRLRREDDPGRLPELWVLRENKWRALRHGMDAQIIHQHTYAQCNLKEDILIRLHWMAPYFTALGYHDQLEVLRNICSRGNSTQRQRAVYSKRGDVEDVLRHNALEFESGEPCWT